MSDLDKINSIFNAKIDSVKTKEELQIIKTEFFGKNGQITQQFKILGSLDSEKRKEFASNLNKLKDDFTNQNFKFGHGKNIQIDNLKVWIQRLSYVGELGYELYIKISDAKKIYELLIDKGKEFNLSNCGMHAMDIMRMESGFLHWGHDISPEENQYQSGLEFTIGNKKQIDFIGKEALSRIKEKKVDRIFAMFTLKNNKPGIPLMLHDEPIYLKNEIIGRTTSGNYSFNFKKNLAFGYIKNYLSSEELLNSEIYIEIEKKKYQAEILLKPLKKSNFKNI